MSLRCAPGRAARAVGQQTTLPNCAEPPSRRASPPSLSLGAGAPPSRPSGRASLMRPCVPDTSCRRSRSRTRTSCRSNGGFPTRPTPASPRPSPSRADARTAVREGGLRAVEAAGFQPAGRQPPPPPPPSRADAVQGVREGGLRAVVAADSSARRHLLGRDLPHRRARGEGLAHADERIRTGGELNASGIPNRSSPRARSNPPRGDESPGDGRCRCEGLRCRDGR